MNKKNKKQRQEGRLRKRKINRKKHKTKKEGKKTRKQQHVRAKLKPPAPRT